MRTELFQQDSAGDWSQPLDPELNGPNTLVLIFANSVLLDDPAAFTELTAAYPDAVFAGCSTAGEILDGTVADHSITASVSQFEHTRVVKAVAPLNAVEQSREAGAALAQQLRTDDLRAVLVFGPGLDVNGSDLVRGLVEGLPEDIVVTGGLAGDGSHFSRTWVLADKAPAQGHAVAIGLYGDHIQVGHGSSGGWEIFGPERLVTRSEGNVLYELDDRPALELYKQYLGELADGLPATGLRFPLALRESPDSDRQLVRTVLSVDEQDQSMTFAGDIPQDWLAQLMRASSNQLIEGAENAAIITAQSNLGDASVLALAISCVGRRMVLGEGTEEELEATLSIFPAGTRQVGFYSYGELSPYASGACELHNQTMTLTTLHET